MDVAQMSSAALAAQQSLLATQVQMAVFKRVQEIQAQGLMQLLNAASASYSNPAHLGNSIDTFA